MKVLWFVLLSVLWPLLQIVVFYVRFQRMPPEPGFVFLPLGILSALLFLFLWEDAWQRQRVGLVIGYLLATPVALVSSLMGGLLSTTWGPTVFGAIPLMVGIGLGYVIAGVSLRFWPER